jgi:hypothetical protein
MLFARAGAVTEAAISTGSSCLHVNALTCKHEHGCPISLGERHEKIDDLDASLKNSGCWTAVHEGGGCFADPTALV